MALQDTALRLIEKRGRVVQLVKSGVARSDPDKPWRGPADDGVDDPKVDSITVTVPGLFTSAARDPIRVLVSEVSTDEKDTSGKKQLLIPALSDQGQDLAKFDYVLDGGERWSIDSGELIKPGEIAYIYTLKVSQ